ncbi:MAG TPA: GAP family protein [Gaiellaceae bacterium]|jgi:threonine/homoserine/homoserine lactone efflux protein|nr:GAP family protein [Gaiellaceae bacterium]
MGQAIGDILPLAIGVAISPVPIIAIVLMLGTPRARGNGIAFAIGWVAGLTLAGAIMLAIASGNATTGSGEPETWVSLLKVVLGTLFLLLALKQWRGRPAPGQEAAMPKWMQAIDRFTAAKSLAAGFLLSALNPKNLALTIAAAAAIAQADISTGEEAGTLAIFIALGSLTILAPLVIYLTLGDRAARILDDLKVWMAAHNAAIMSVLLLILGFKLIGDAIAGLST